MKKIVTLLLTTLLTITTSSSQNISREISVDSTVSITSNQLRYTNLIFVEHEKLLIENSLLNSQLTNYQNKLQLSYEIEQDQLAQINQYKIINDAYLLQIEELNRSISNKNRIITGLKIGGLTICVTAAILLFIK